MTDQFFERPILNSPYKYPAQHWELDEEGQPTNQIIDRRRRSDLITPVPKPKKRRKSKDQAAPRGTRLRVEVRDADSDEVLDQCEAELKIDLEEWD